jgi:hypothetical protein
VRKPIDVPIPKGGLMIDNGEGFKYPIAVAQTAITGDDAGVVGGLAVNQANVD